MCRLIKNSEVKRPNLVKIWLHHLFAIWDELLAPGYPVRADHEQDGAVVPLRLGHLIRQLEGLAEQLTLLGQNLTANALVHVDLQGIFLEETSEKAEKWTPNQIAPVIVLRKVADC